MLISTLPFPISRSRPSQFFVLGASGRFCADNLNSHCMKVDNGWNNAAAYAQDPALDLMKY